MEALWSNMGIACRKMVTFNRAAKIYSKSLGTDRGNAKHIMQGHAFFNLGMFKKAIKSYKRALKNNPNNDKIHLNLGIAYKNLGMFKEAVNSFKQVINIHSENANAHFNLGLSYGSLNMYKEARQSLIKSIYIDPDNANAHYNLAIIHLKFKDSKAAINQYRCLNKLSPVLASKLSELLNDESE
jgi:tetratricopeptide (TPR) repeat protein